MLSMLGVRIASGACLIFLLPYIFALLHLIGDIPYLQYHVAQLHVFVSSVPAAAAPSSPLKSLTYENETEP